jgi:copper homeostasis protein (lipoprotein)
MRFAPHSRLVATLGLVVAAACGGAASDADAGAAAPNPIGETQCADCDLIATSLTLFPGDSFVLREGYRGTRDGDKDYTTRGKYAFLSDASDPAAGRILMLSPALGPTRRFRELGDTALRQLDERAREFDASYNVFLRREP